MLMMKIQQAKVVFPDRKKYKIDYSDEILDLISRLLEKDKSTRLGSGKDDFVDVLQHPVFKNVNIEDLENKRIPAKFKPNCKKDLKKYFNAEDSAAAIGDTYIPKDSRNIVQNNQQVFDNFNKKVKK